MSETHHAPLGGVRVIDFTQVMLGPCATQMLGDFGADVIKIERPGAPAISVTQLLSVNPLRQAMNNAVFASLNRNKRSVEIDTKSDAGSARRSLIWCASADVVGRQFPRRCDGPTWVLATNALQARSIHAHYLCFWHRLSGLPAPTCPQGRAGCAGSGHVRRDGDPTQDPSIPRYPSILRPCAITPRAWHLVQGISGSVADARKEPDDWAAGRMSRFTTASSRCRCREAAHWSKIPRSAELGPPCP